MFKAQCRLYVEMRPAKYPLATTKIVFLGCALVVEYVCKWY